MRTITVDVTQQDIYVGMRRNCTRCPVALALARTLGNTFIAVVRPTYLHVTSKTAVHVVPLPVDEIQRIRLYDEGLAMEAHSFSFTLQE